MDKTRQKHCLTAIGLMLATAVALAFQGPPEIAGDSGVCTKLPDKVGACTGIDRFYCQNEQCANGTMPVTNAPPARCPLCEGELAPDSIAMRLNLPGARIVSKYYSSPGGENYFVWLVVSGAEQKGIHRPQQCLRAQGDVIERKRIVEVPLDGRPPLNTAFLDLRSGEGSAMFAYWFVSGNRETPHHLKRLLWMSADRLLHNRASPWTYVAIRTHGRDSPEETSRRLSSFIGDLHGHLAESPAAPTESASASGK